MINTSPDVIRTLIHQENEMINHRMNWFLILQGFMFTSIGFAWEKNSALCVVFACVGMLSALSVGVLLYCGILAIKKLEKSAVQNEEAVIGKGSEETSLAIHLLLPWNFLPFLMIAAWSALIVIRVYNIS